ncbi:MAG: hypothetical protein FJ387_28595 [Verrucomicrobia bacterium]|nr:hypothetical protein [Verrucomicrobiota bacterium]
MKLEPHQAAWLEAQARSLKRSKGSIVRDLIEGQREGTKNESVGHALRDLCGVFKGPRDLSTRSLKGYGRA